MPTPPRNEVDIRTFAPELNIVKNYLPQLERQVAAAYRKLGFPQEDLRGGAALYELIERLTYQMALLNQANGGSILTALAEPRLLGSRIVQAGDNITIVDRGPGKGFVISAADAPAASGGSYPPQDIDTVSYFKDDFQSSFLDALVTNAYTGYIGEMGWTARSVGTGSIVQANADADTFGHPGVIRVTTGTAQNDHIILALPATVGGLNQISLNEHFSYPGTFQIRALVKLTSVGSHVEFAFGIHQIATILAASDVINETAALTEFRFKAGSSANWEIFNAQTGGADDSQDTGIAADTNWVLLQMAWTGNEQTGDVTITMTITPEGGTPTEFTTTLDQFNQTSSAPFFAIKTTSAAADTGEVLIDLYDCLITGLNRVG